MKFKDIKPGMILTYKNEKSVVFKDMKYLLITSIIDTPEHKSFTGIRSSYSDRFHIPCSIPDREFFSACHGALDSRLFKELKNS